MKLQVLCRALTIVLMCLVILGAGHAEADENGWQILDLSVMTDKAGVRLKAGKLSYGDTQLLGVNYFCPTILSLYPKHQCQNGQITFTYEQQEFDVYSTTDFNANNSNWAVSLSAFNQQIELSLNSNDDNSEIKFNELQVAQFLRQANHPLNAVFAKFNGTVLGNLTEFSLHTQDAIQFSGVSLEYSDDIVVADLVGSLLLDLSIKNKTLDVQLEITAGEVLFDELYVDFSEYPVSMTHHIQVNNEQKYEITSEIINQQSLIINSHVLIDDGLNWAMPELKVKVIDSHHFNQNILSNVLGIYGFGNSQMSGGFDLQVNSIETSFDQWQVTFNDFYLLNEKRKIQADALDGKVFWNASQLSADSLLNWQNLTLAGLPIDASAMRFNFSKDQVSLLGVHEFPMFDGAIILKELTMDTIFSAEMGMTLNATVLPISLKLITEKLNWPVMPGTISGDIPGMVKKGNVIDFLGALNLTVFNGNMLIENLSLERLFAVAPVIAADVSFELFDLALLTETFGFGQITGRLSGEINDLRITNWRTDRLDAQVYTVKTKKVKQTISQKAIENISSLGGIKGAISKTFLRFFDEFTYKKIKLSCKLHNSVCEIGGLKNQNNEFVIVEGGGIPKINIVGFVRSINWEEFVARLLNANYSN